jgi:ferric-dicitrate binding protein FerR (iron transport regulator)
MDRHDRSKMNTQIYEEACTWFVECRAGDLDDSDRREFDHWLRKSPEHLSSYLEIAAIWNEGPLLDPDGKWSADTLFQHALDADDDNVVLLPGVVPTARPVSAEDSVSVAPAQGVATVERAPSRASSTRPREWFRRWRRLAIAASLLAILGGTLTMLELSAPIYATALGEQRSIQFEDGSTVELNSRSKIRVTYSKQERNVELIKGQALFHVAHDVSRPFIVAVGATRVRAVGTQFDVYRKSNGTVVTVVEGRVAVYSAAQGPLSEASGAAPTLPIPAQAPAPLPGSLSPRKHSGALSSTASSASSSTASSLEGQATPPNSLSLGLKERSSFLLAAGEQVIVTVDAAQKTANPNIAGATAWREREIVFESATLSDVAEEFNRYNQRQLVIEDPEFYGFHISGVFSSTDPDSLIRFLRQRPGVKVTEASGEIRVERHAP